jgi:hypothetical protein
MNLTSYESPTPSSRATTLEPQHRVLGAQGHGNPEEGCGGLGALVSMTGVLQPLPWEPDSDNQKVVTAIARKGEATGEQEAQRGVSL